MLNGYRTIIFAAVSLLGSIMAQLGVELDSAGLTEAIMQLGGAIGAIYFRVIATKGLVK